MNLYLISQNLNNDYDTYDAAVVCAASEEKARLIHPDGLLWFGARWLRKRPDGTEYPEYGKGTWAPPDQVKVLLLGIASEDISEGTWCASFCAG